MLLVVFHQGDFTPGTKGFVLCSLDLMFVQQVGRYEVVPGGYHDLISEIKIRTCSFDMTS